MKKYNRKSIRLKGYDYSKEGLYYITINTYKNKYLFGEILNQKMILNQKGKMVQKWFLKLEEKFNIKCHEYIIMPNHIHFIIEIVGAIPCNIKDDAVGIIPCNYPRSPIGKNMVLPVRPHEKKLNNCPRSSSGENMVSPVRLWDYDGLGRYVSWFKRMTMNEYIRNVKKGLWEPFNKRIWHRNYYEHIVRNENDFWRIVNYIKRNPENFKKWN